MSEEFTYVIYCEILKKIKSNREIFTAKTSVFISQVDPTVWILLGGNNGDHHSLPLHVNMAVCIGLVGQQTFRQGVVWVRSAQTENLPCGPHMQIKSVLLSLIQTHTNARTHTHIHLLTYTDTLLHTHNKHIQTHTHTQRRHTETAKHVRTHEQRCAPLPLNTHTQTLHTHKLYTHTLYFDTLTDLVMRLSGLTLTTI